MSAAVEVDISKLGTGNTFDAVMESVVTPFNKAIKLLCALLRAKYPNNGQVARLNRILHLLSDGTPYILIARSAPNLVKAHVFITNNDESYFTKGDFSSMVKNDENKDMIFEVMDLVKKGYNDTTPEERVMIWRYINIMLACSAHYMKACKQYDKSPV
jgi:hypothetical protein